MVLDDNMFIAEFESEADKKRVLDGSPWYIGRQAVGRQVVILQNQKLNMMENGWSG
jgi:hypothetical protein